VALDVLEGRLRGARLARLERADPRRCRVHPYAASAPQAGISLGPYTAVARWIRRIEALPG